MRPTSDRVPLIRRPHRYEWLWEPLAGDPGFVLRAMFGAKAAYLDGKLMLCFSAGAEPWRGVLVCTEQAHHESLRAQFPVLAPHAILPKWLYLPESADEFEATAAALVRCARTRDARLGVLPKPRRRKRLASPPRPRARRATRKPRN